MSTVVPTPERWQAWSDCGCVECWAEVSAVMAALEAERDEARAELARVRDRAWAAESALTHRYALRREIEILLGIDPGAASDEAFQAGVNAVKRLTAERDEAWEELARLQEIGCRGCDCSMDDACAFARERDKAKADRDRALALLRQARSLIPLTLLADEIDALLEDR